MISRYSFSGTFQESAAYQPLDIQRTLAERLEREKREKELYNFNDDLSTQFSLTGIHLGTLNSYNQLRLYQLNLQKLLMTFDALTFLKYSSSKNKYCNIVA